MLRPLAPMLIRRALFVAAALLAGCGQTIQIEETRQATGIKLGEVRQTSAELWARLTESQYRSDDGALRKAGSSVIERGPFDQPDPATLEGSVPGAAGRMRVRIGTSLDLIGADETEWEDVDEETDYTHRFRLTGLSPNTRYYYAVDTTDSRGATVHRPREGTFQTAPSADGPADTTFAMLAGLSYAHMDHPEGFQAYNSLARLRPDFLIVGGNSVRYDADPLARTPALARYHWHRMASLPTAVRFHLQFPAYWLKNDHDSYADDAWPGLRRNYMGSFTFEDGVEVYREQVAVGGRPYRTFQWSSLLQIWMLDTREFRSQNPMPDGPEKSILGTTQRNWLMDTMQASRASWKLLVSPTPVVGPDRLIGRFDNHSNASWQTEGQALRDFFAEKIGESLFVVTGDTDWQYHSVDPVTGLHEFASGPASDGRAGNAAEENESYHRFHRVGGGFLSVQVALRNARPTIVFRHHDVDGNVLYEYTQEEDLPL